MTTVTKLNFAHLDAFVRWQEGFKKGRARAIANARARLEAPTAAIRAALDVDILSGKPVHGRASRIARKLRMNRRTTDRILAALMSVTK
jgi:hypothetical protein